MRYVISDIHGTYKTISDLLETILKDDKDAKFIFVGDYVDRGPKSREVVSLMLQLSEDPKHVFLRGNHDDIACLFLNEISITNPETMIDMIGCSQQEEAEGITLFNKNFHKLMCWWLGNGFDSFLTSYDINEMIIRNEFGRFTLEKFRQEIKDKIPQTHKGFFANLPLCYKDSDIHVVHAWADPYKSLPAADQMDPEICLWGRPANPLHHQMSMEINWDRIVIVGHTPVQCFGHDRGMSIGKLRMIDTASFRSDGGITAYCVETDKCFFFRNIDP